MSDQKLSLFDIENSLKMRRTRLQFEPIVEASYEAYIRTRRTSSLHRTILRSLAIYNLLVIADFLLLPRTFGLSLVLHVIVTAASLGISASITAETPRATRECLATLVAVLMFAQVTIIYALNKGPGADNYHYFAPIIVVLLNANLRVDVRVAIWVSLLMAAVYAGTLWGLGISPVSARVMGTAVMATTVFATLMACWRTEMDARYAFLKRSQDQLQRDAVEASANRDDLTGLFNRRYLYERVVGLWNTSESRSSVAVLMIDVDCFKAYNDLYGHLAGDICLTLACLARFSRNCPTRPTSLCASAVRNSSSCSSTSTWRAPLAWRSVCASPSRPWACRTTRRPVVAS